MRSNYTVNFGSSISDLLYLNSWNMVERSSCSLVKGHHDLGLNRLRQVGFYLLLLLIDLGLDWLCTRGFASLCSIVLSACITTIFLLNCWIIFEAAYAPEWVNRLIPRLGNFKPLHQSVFWSGVCYYWRDFFNSIWDYIVSLGRDSKYWLLQFSTA